MRGYAGGVAKAKKKPVARKRTSRQAIIIVVPGGKISKATLNKLVRNPVLLGEDEADYRYSMAAIRQAKGKSVSAESVLRKYGRHVDR